MGKTTITITVDSDVIDEIRQLRINISGEINDFLRSILARYNEDVEGINIRLERIELDKAMKKLSQWQTTVKATQARIERWESLQTEKEKVKLEEQKEAIESANRCDICKEVKSDEMKMHNFGKKKVCNSCYMSSTAVKIKEWMKE